MNVPADYEKLRGLLSDFGVPFRESTDDDETFPFIEISCNDEGDKVYGWPGSRIRFFFENGRFKNCDLRSD